MITKTAPWLTPERRDRLGRAARRSLYWQVPAAVFFALSFPAIFDLKTLFQGIAGICSMIGAAVWLFTWFDES